MQNEIAAILAKSNFPYDGEYGKTIAAALSFHMTESNSLDRLIVLFDVLSHMVTTSLNLRSEEAVGADDNSVMGFFLRRCWCDFAALPFEGVCELARACEEYGLATSKEKRSMTAFCPRITADRFLSERISAIQLHAIDRAEDRTAAMSFRVNDRNSEHRPRHVDAMEEVLDDDLMDEIINQHHPPVSSSSSSDIHQLMEPIQSLGRVTSRLSGIHLAHATAAIAQRDIHASIDSIHMFSDTPNDCYVPNIGIISSGESIPLPRERTMLQAAALQLSITHTRLGQLEPALLALSECMRTAQQAGDDECLAHALSVLCQVMERATPGRIELQSAMKPYAAPHIKGSSSIGGVATMPSFDGNGRDHDGTGDVTTARSTTLPAKTSMNQSNNKRDATSKAIQDATQRRRKGVGSIPSQSAIAHVIETASLLRRCLKRSQELGLPHLMAYSTLALARHALLHPLVFRKRDKKTINTMTCPLHGSVADDGDGVWTIADATTDAKLPLWISHLDATTQDKETATNTFLQSVLDAQHPLWSNADRSTPPSLFEIFRATASIHALQFSCTLSAAVPIAPHSTSGLACLRIFKGLPDFFMQSFEPGSSIVGCQRATAGEVQQISASSLLLRSAAFELHGSARLSQTYLLSFLSVNGRSASIDTCTIALAHLAVSTAMHHGFEAAQRIVDYQNRKYNQSEVTSPAWRAALLTMEHRRALHRGDVRKALDVSGELIALATPDDSHSIGYRLDGEESIVMALVAGQQYAQAERAARRVYKLAKEVHHPLTALKMLLMLARILIEAGAWKQGVPYIARVLEEYRAVHADMIGAEAAVLMSRVWLQTGVKRHVKIAVEEMDAALPLILAHGDLDLKGRACIAYVEACMMEMDIRELAFETDQDQELVCWLQEGIQCFKKLEDWKQMTHAFYLMSLLYDKSGNIDERNRAAKSFIELSEKKACGPGVVE